MENISEILVPKSPKAEKEREDIPETERLISISYSAG